MVAEEWLAAHPVLSFFQIPPIADANRIGRPEPALPRYTIRYFLFLPNSSLRATAMILKNRLFTPGPTPLLPAAQNAMAVFSLHHRTADFRALFTRVLADLKTFIGTENECLLLASSGTGAMEAAVSNLTSPGDKVLVITAGKFGERWTSLAKTYGCQIETVRAPYGQTFDLAEVKAA